MLLSSISRFGIERALALKFGINCRVLHSALNSQRVQKTFCGKHVPGSIISSNFSKRLYATTNGRTSKAGSKSSKSLKTASRTSKKTKETKGLKKPSITKKPIKKPAKTLVKKPKRVKRVLTEAEKTALKQAQLKAQALRAPRSLPRSARTVYMAEHLKGTDPNEIQNIFSRVSTSWKTIDPVEREEYEKKAEVNRAVNLRVLNEWLSKYTPDDIRIANNARRQISKGNPHRRFYRQLKDARLPKRPVNNFCFYVQERFDKGEFKGVEAPEAMKKLAEDYNALSPSELQKYHILFQQSREKYYKDFKTTFKRNPGRVRKDS